MIETCHCTKPPRSAASINADIARFSPGELECYEAAVAAHIDKLPLHEAGHATMAACTGVGVEFVTCDGSNPHTRYSPVGGDRTLRAGLLRTCAGDIATAVGTFTLWRPGWAHLKKSLARARDGQHGTCDYCCSASALVHALPDVPDETLIASWREIFEIGFWFFSDDEMRGGLISLANALRESVALDGDEVNKILGGYKLTESYRDVLANLPRGFVLGGNSR